MRELELSEIKKIEFETLLHFKEYCEYHRIKYFLSNGTLLGAVKYKGFIPWDDDIDVFVPKGDFEKLISIYENTDKFCLVTRQKDKRYIFPYAKLSNKETEVKNGADFKIGLSIDIFPLEFFPDDRKAAIRLVRQSFYQLQMLCFSVAHFESGKSFFRTCVKYIVTAVAKLVGRNQWANLLNSTRKKTEEKSGEKYVGCVAWPVYGEREIIPAEVFSDTVLVEFEGELFPAPVGYDIYLRSLYGDYEMDPPLEKQKTHHSFKAYKL